MIKNEEAKTSVTIALVIALSLTVISDLTVFLTTQNIGHVLTAVAFGAVIGIVIFGAFAMSARHVESNSGY